MPLSHGSQPTAQRRVTWLTSLKDAHMPKTERISIAKPRPHRNGSATAVETVVGNKATHIGLVSIQNNGRDERGRVLGTNGMAWVLAK
jgi:hypothetical protein